MLEPIDLQGRRVWAHCLLLCLTSSFSVLTKYMNTRHFLAAFAFLLMSGAVIGAPTYQITVLSGIGPGPYGINSSGQIVGTSGDSAAVWDSGNLLKLNTYQGSEESSGGQAINDLGHVAGFTYDSATGVRGALWKNGVMTNLGVFDGTSYNEALGINDSDLVVGYGIGQNQAGSAQNFAFVWDNGSFTNLGEGMAWDVNNLGQVVGGNDSSGAFLWQNGTVTALGGIAGGSSLGQAMAINDSGQVVGWASGPNGWEAFLWQDGMLISLGGLPGAKNSIAFDINSNGWVVGRSHFQDGEGSFLWIEGEGLFNLLDLIDPNDPLKDSAYFTEARSINDRGQIVGYGKMGAFLLTPIERVPEPNAIYLVLAGLLSIAALARQRRRYIPL